MNGLMQIFIKTAQTGLQTGTAVLAVLLCRQLFLKKQPRNFCCMLWVLIFLRFLCPVTWNVSLPVPQGWSQKTEAWKEGWREWQQSIGLQAEAGWDDPEGMSLEALDGADGAEGWLSAGAAGKTGKPSSGGGRRDEAADTDGTAEKQTGKENDADAGNAPGEQSDSADDVPGKQLSGADNTLKNTSEEQVGSANNAGEEQLSGADNTPKNALGENPGSADNAAEEQLSGAARPDTGRTTGAWLLQPARWRLLVQGASLLWLAGAMVFLLAALLRYFRLKRRLRFAVKCASGGQRVRETDQITSPFVMGIFRPEIYLPTGLSETEKYHIIAHERAHIERRDPLVKVLCCLGLVFQWMNPFAWIAFYFYNQDMEMACDERALKRFGRKERLDYSRTLLLTAARSSGLQLPVFFGESNAKRRVENILQKKKRTIAGGCLAAVLVCGLAALLFIRNGGENDRSADQNKMTENTAGQETEESGIGTAGQTKTESGTAAAGQENAESGNGTADQVSAKGGSGTSGQEDARELMTGEVEAYPFVENGQLRVRLYNFTGWDHMYVNQVDFRVEEEKEDSWETVEPDRTVNRITSQPALVQLRWPKELGGLLAQYEEKLEDGAYRIVLYCQDTPVEDAAAEPDEIYAPFLWKGGAVFDGGAMQERLGKAQERYASSDHQTTAFYYEEEPSSREEEIQRREEEYEVIRASDEEKCRLYEKKLQETEARMEAAAPEVKEAYSIFADELRGELSRLESTMENLKDTYIDGRNITQEGEEYDRQLMLVREQLSELEEYIAEEEALQVQLAKEMEKAQEKQRLIEESNVQAELMQQLMEQRQALQKEIQRLNQETARCRMMEWMGYDPVEARSQELAQLPKDLNAEEAGRYGISVIRRDGDSSGVRDELYQFWLETEGTGKLPEELSAVELDQKNFNTGEEEQDPETLYRKVKSMTFTFASETDKGDLIITSITAWGNGYLILVDQSRDRQKSSGAEDIAVYCYDYLHWLSNPKATMEAVIATDEYALTYEAWTESLLSSKWHGDEDRLAVALLTDF